MTHSIPVFPGAIPSPIDERDWQWQEIGFAAEPFDWKKGYDIEVELRKKLNDIQFNLPVKDQNGSGSCGGQAWATYDSVFEAMATGTFEERSAKYIYAQTFVPPAGGSAGRTNSELVVKQGVSREALLSSYENGNPPSENFMRRPQDITPEAKADAKKSRAKGYANVGVDIDAVAQAIRENYGCVIGIYGKDNGTWLTPFPKPPVGNPPYWAHWLYAGKAAMVNGEKHIGVLNSWGRDCGQGGWQWISETYYKTKIQGGQNALWEGWTQVFDPASITPGYSYTFVKELDFGAFGGDVVALQTVLKLEDCFPSVVPATGFFGLITQNAVKKFQKKYGIDQVGRVGKITLAKLNSLYSK